MARLSWPLSSAAKVHGLVLVLCAAGGAMAARPDGEPSPADAEAAALVRSALRFEIEGDVSYRNLVLQIAINQFSDFAPARWHAGQVRVADRWLPLEEAEAEAAEDKRLTEYAGRRDEVAGAESAEAHLKLARWCLHAQLNDQARYHLAQVFRFPATPEQREEAARRLSFRLLRDEGAAGVLMSEAEIRRREQQAEQAKQGWEHWTPALKQIAEELAQPNEKRQAAALAELAEVRDPAAVPALEAVLSTQGEPQALAVVDQLSRIPQHAATMSLARHALFSPSLNVRAAATAQLRNRPIHEFAPWLLSGLVSPVKSRFWIQPLPNGSFSYMHDFYRSDANRDYVFHKKMNFTPAPDIVFFRGFGDPNPAHAKLVDPPDPLVSPEVVGRSLLAKAVGTQQQVAAQNKRAMQINSQIDAVLGGVTGQKLNADPVAWWQWWQEYNELQTPDKRPLIASYASTQQTYATGSRVVKYIPSCFPAGTTVWTLRGATPIETIRGGDRVLAQNVDTGELAYKTVLGTTVRPPTPLVKITLPEGEVQATRGHPFWVSGSGWKMAKFLEAGNRLHTIDGFSVIQEVAEAPPQPAYNLIVEDFATYFVGRQRLLVHDNMLREPTLSIVPGFTGK